jgi:hypothetical protein
VENQKKKVFVEVNTMSEENDDIEFCKDMEEAEEYASKHCDECDKPKTNHNVDLCFSCARKKAKSLGHKLTQDEYDLGVM